MTENAIPLEPITARLCAFDHYSGIPEDHECEWLRGKSTVEFAVSRARDGGQPSWRMGDEYVIVPIPAGMTAGDVVLQITGQLRMDVTA